MRCFILGSGSWGTALAWILGRRGVEVSIWCRRPERAAELAAGRHGYLPGMSLPPAVRPFTSDESRGAAARGRFDFAISAVPVQFLRGVLEATQSWIPRDISWVSISKGLELKTLALPSRVLEEYGIASDVGILSGPSHAEEVVLGHPTTVVLGHSDPARGGPLQEVLSADNFRVYLNSDRIGVELGGALKNVTAIAAGIAIGYGFGDNTVAALVTRGSVEMARLGVALGGRRETFGGLSGIGDLMVTCYSQHSRNRRFGIRVGKGELPAKILAGLEQVVEGAATARAVVELSGSVGIEMPIAEEVSLIVHEGKDIRAGVEALLSRSLKQE